MAEDPHLNVDVKVCGPAREGGLLPCVTVKGMLVDTGATHSMIPRSALGSTGIQPTGQMSATLADGKKITFDQAMARVCLVAQDGKRAACAEVPIGIVDDGHLATVGASTLAALNAKLNFGRHRGITATGAIIDIPRRTR